MKKRTNKFLVAGIVLIVIVALFFVFRNGIENAVLGSGFFVLSSGQADFVSNDATLGGKAWLVTVSQNGAGNYIVGTFANSNFNDSGVSAKYPLTLSATTTSETKSWDIVRSNTEYIADMSFEKVNVFLHPSFLLNMENYCMSNHPLWQDAFGVKRSGSAYGFCVGFENLRPVAEVSADSVDSYVVEMKAVVNGETVTGTLSNTGSNSAWLGDKVYVTGVGGLVSGYNVDFPANTLFYWNDVSAKWIPISRTAWNTLSSSYVALQNCMAGISAKSEDLCLSDYNSAKATAMYERAVSISGGSSARTTGDASKGKFVISLSQPIQFPVFSMKIDAEWLGIVQLVGMPKIVGFGSVNDACGGLVLNEEVKVKNVGQYQGSFDVFATCVSPLSSANRIRVTLNPSETQSIFIPIVGSTKADVSAKCVFTAVDVNNPNNKDTASKSYDCNAITICTPLVYQCNGNEIRQCNSAGTTTTKVEDCPKGCIYSGNKAVCKTENGTDDYSTCKAVLMVGNAVLIPNLKPSCLGFLTPLKVGATILVFLLTFIFGFTLFRDNLFPNKKKQNNVALWIIFPLLIALVLAWVTYYYILWGVFGFVAYLLIRWILGQFVLPNIKRRV